MHNEKSNQLRQGLVVFLVLAVLTALEFWVAVGGLTNVLMLLFIVFTTKAALIAIYFMHFGKVFQPEEGGHG